jgi:hypothetical protein
MRLRNRKKRQTRSHTVSIMRCYDAHNDEETSNYIQCQYLKHRGPTASKSNRGCETKGCKGMWPLPTFICRVWGKQRRTSFRIAACPRSSLDYEATISVTTRHRSVETLICIFPCENLNSESVGYEQYCHLRYDAILTVKYEAIRFIRNVGKRLRWSESEAEWSETKWSGFTYRIGITRLCSDEL